MYIKSGGIPQFSHQLAWLVPALEVNHARVDFLFSSVKYRYMRKRLFEKLELALQNLNI